MWEKCNNTEHKATTEPTELFIFAIIIHIYLIANIFISNLI